MTQTQKLPKLCRICQPMPPHPAPLRSSPSAPPVLSSQLLFIAPPPTQEHAFPLSVRKRLSSQFDPLLLERSNGANTPAFSTSPFTCLRGILMQLPILYSIPSSGEVTLALHGWQNTFLQNCIVVDHTQHCPIAAEATSARLRVCTSVPQWLNSARGLPVTCTFKAIVT